MRRGEANPLNDYDQGSAAISDEWWPLFPLQRGLRPGKVLDANATRRLFVYHDNRTANRPTRPRSSSSSPTCSGRCAITLSPHGATS
jgi:hypothetical protein